MTMPPRLNAVVLLPIKSTERSCPQDHFVLGSPTFAERVTGSFIDKAERLDMKEPRPSDHAPVIGDVDN